MLSSGAPWIFDIVGGGMTVIAVLALTSGAPAMNAALTSNPNDIPIRNLTRMSAAAAGFAMSIYVVSFLAWGMGGYLRLLAFLPNFAAWSWTVALTVFVWGIIAVWSVITFAKGWSKPPGDRKAIPFARCALMLAIVGSLWLFGMFFPVPDYRHFPLPWQAATTANFFLHCAYIAGTVEPIALLLLPLLPSLGTADKEMSARLADRVRPMYPARRPGK